MAIGFTVTGITDKVVPDKTLTKQSQPKVRTHKFGDGYEQRSVDGINNINESYSLSFTNRAKAEADDIIAFFDTKAGATAFDFTIPDTNAGGNERTIKVVCDSWSVSFTNNEFHNIQTTFRRVYEP